MTVKIEFIFTHGHSFTATGVVETSVYVENDTDNSSIVYHSNSVKNDVVTSAEHRVPMHDLQFAVIRNVEHDTTTIIHGIVKDFDISPSYSELVKLTKLESTERAEKRRAENRKAKEAEKFLARRAKRAAARKEFYSK